MAPSDKNEGPPLWAGRQEFLLEKPLPSSEESEQVCIGSVFLDVNIMTDLSGKLTHEDFYNPLNRRVFAAMVALHGRGDKIDPITVGEELKKEGSLESIGGIAGLLRYTHGLPHLSNVDEYIAIIKTKAVARDGIRRCNAIIGELLAEEEDPREILSMGSDTLDTISDEGQTTEFKSVDEMVDTQIELAHHIQASGNPITGLSSGFIELDVQTGGFQRQDLIIVGGRPSQGKTALGLSFAQNAAFRGEAFVAVFSIEMSREQLINRAICSEAGVNGLNFRSGILSHTDWEKINEARTFMNGSMLMIDDTPIMYPSLLKQKCRRLVKQHNRPLDLIVIDYLQMMHWNPNSKQQENRQQEMTKISRELKIIAKVMDCPVIALSQLSRAPENRAANNHRPMTSDLRESGAIEQDADVCLFIYREEMYPKADGTVVGHGEAEIIIGKQRNGPTGTIKLFYDRESTRFGNYTSEF